VLSGEPISRLREHRAGLLNTPDPEQLAREIAEAEARGDKLIVVGNLQVLIQKWRSDTGDQE
jgi:hypothetical protein